MVALWSSLAYYTHMTRTYFTALYIKQRRGTLASAQYLARVGVTLEEARKLLLGHTLCNSTRVQLQLAESRKFTAV